MKQKILFYGNCHTLTLGKYFVLDPELQEKFEVIVPDKSCKPMSRSGIYFRVWTKENHPIQQEFYTAVHEKIKQADIFVFQDMGLSSCIPELTTKFLCDAEEIVEFLCTSDDPKLTEILEQEYPISTVYAEGINENHQRGKLCMEQYPTYICMESFLKEIFKTKVVAFDKIHPTKAYFVELLRLLLTNIGLTDFNIKEEHCKVPGRQRTKINPMQFKFFREYFPLLNDEFETNCQNRNLIKKLSEMLNLVDPKN